MFIETRKKIPHLKDKTVFSFLLTTYYKKENFDFDNILYSMCFGFFSIELKKHLKVLKKACLFQFTKKFTETTDLANTCADLFMQSLVTGIFRPQAPTQTETELTQNIIQSAQLSSSNAGKSLCPLLMLH